MKNAHAAAPLEERRGDWIQMYSGRPFWPLDPRPEDVDVADFAHHLSRIARYGGAVQFDYSVAEHCVLLSRYFAPVLTPALADRRRMLALWALWHDAAEAITGGDPPSPVKPALTGYAPIETRILTAVALAVGLTPLTVPPEVKRADELIRNDERLQVLRPSLMPWRGDVNGEPAPGLGVMVKGWRAREAEAAFLDRHDELIRSAP